MKTTSVRTFFRGVGFRSAGIVTILLTLNTSAIYAVAPNWTPAWTRTIEAGSWTDVRGIESDSLGNIYVAGRTDGLLGAMNPGGYDGYLAKYDPAGNRVWAQQFGGDYYDGVTGIAVDSSDNIVVVGDAPRGTTGSTAGFDEAFIRKFDAAGNTLWSTAFGSLYNDEAFGVATDSLGNVFVVGKRGTTPPQIHDVDDAFLRKYDAGGNFIWDRTIGTNQRDIASDVAVDSAGNIVMVGSTSGELVTPVVGQIDAFVSMFDQAGNNLWTNQYPNADQAAEVDTDTHGNSYISGNAGIHGFLLKLNPAGDLSWNRLPLDAIINGHVSLDGFGNVYTSGYDEQGEAFIAHYLENGTFMSMHSPSGLHSGWGPYIAASERALYAANSPYNNGFAVTLVKYDVVPEPGSLVMLLGLASAGVCLQRRR